MTNGDDLLESEIENRVCRYAKSKGIRHRKYTSPSYRSVPDRMLWLPSTPRRDQLVPIVFFIEFKRKGKKSTDAQLREHERLREDGFVVYVVDNIDEGKRIIDVWADS